MAEKFKNNVSMTLASSITAVSTTIALSSGDGAQLPVIASGTADTFRISLWDKLGNVEIISICRRDDGSDTLYVGTGTAHQSAGSTAGRGMEGTTAIAVTSSDYHVIKMSVTAAQAEDAVKYSSLGDITAEPAEINSTCDGNTATAAELSELHGGGALKADFEKLHAITVAAANINDAAATARYKVIGFSKNGNGTGDQTVTGVGFRGKAIIFISKASIDTNYTLSFGMSDGTTSYVHDEGSSVNVPPKSCIVYHGDTGTDRMLAELKSIDADGFTVTWSKVGSPTTVSISVMALVMR